jgi:uncharacterized protein
LLPERRTIPPQSGVAFLLKCGQTLSVFDIEGEQVSDLVAYNQNDIQEHLSSGRSLDYASTMFLTSGHTLYSNRSTPMLDIIEDEVGRHDFTLAPCSAAMFTKLYGHQSPHHGCQGNLERALGPYAIKPDQIPTAFNVFMNVDFDPITGAIKVLPPKSKAGQKTVFLAKMDLIIGLTACSAGQSNNFRFKPIGYEIGCGAMSETLDLALFTL